MENKGSGGKLDEEDYIMLDETFDFKVCEYCLLYSVCF